MSADSHSGNHTGKQNKRQQHKLRRHPDRRLVWSDQPITDTPDASGRARPPRPATPTSHTTPTPSSGSIGTPAGLSPRDDAILRALAQLRYLTALQVCLLFFSRTSLPYVRVLLKRLVEAGYLLRMRLPTARAGNAPWVYTLSHRGLAYLQAVGCDEELVFSVSVRLRPSEEHERSYLFLTHTLLVNDVLIAAQLLGRVASEVVLAQMRSEWQLKRMPVRVSMGEKEERMVIPDAWLDFHVHGMSRMCIVLELDHATEAEAALKHKLHFLLAYAAGPYQQAFGTESLTIAFLTTGDARRLERMRTWCEQVLRAQHQEQQADLFFFSRLDPHVQDAHGQIDPRALFCAPVWTRPFATDAVPLLEFVP